MNRRHIDAEWLSVDSAAQVVDASAHTIRRWIKRGQLPASKLICGTWRIKREHLVAFMQGESANSGCLASASQTDRA